MEIRRDSGPGDQGDAEWQRLLAAPLPQILPADELIAAHAPVSAKMGSKDSRPARNQEEREQLSALVQEFRERIPTRHPQDFSKLASGVLIHSRLVEELADGKACSIVAEIRSRQGKCLLASATGLYELSNGPVFIWMRALPAGRQFIALYSKAAFAEELNRVTQRCGDLSAREPRTLLFDYIFDQASKKIAAQYFPGKSVARVEALRDHTNSFRFHLGDTSFRCSIIHHGDTGNISCRFHLPGLI